ncbi:MAG: hypothetical protein JW840_02490 [Candidatus Thermoplasmatota archaeon]|nr:hypothetical protein [Candidatus Thermoplasmatota archaeon]
MTSQPKIKVSVPKIIVGMLILLVFSKRSIVLTLQYFRYGPLDALEVDFDAVDVALVALVDFTVAAFGENGLRVLQQGVSVAYRAFFYQ